MSLLAGVATCEQADDHRRAAQNDLRLNRPDLAIAEFRAILKLDPADVESRVNFGTLLYFQGDYKAAAPELRQALTSRPELWKTWMLLGMCEKRLGNPSAARSDLERALPHLDDTKLRIEAGLELVGIYYSASDLEKAASTIATLRQLAPSDTEILATAQQIYSDQADEALLSVAMLAPESARMHQLMAHQLMRQGNTDGAIAQYRAALAKDAKLAGIHFELGEALSASTSAADRAQAEEEYRAAVAQNPSDEKSEVRLGRIVFAKSDFKAAEADYARALALEPDDPEANLGLGRTLVSLGEGAKALPLLERAVKLDPSDSTAHFRLGSLYRQQGRAADARRELAEFQRLKDLKEHLKDLYTRMRLQTRATTTDPEAAQ